MPKFKVSTKNEIINALSKTIPSDICNDNIVFVCIGTDRSTGDSLGPLIGTFLKKNGYKNVYGTIDDPVHAMNLSEVIAMLPKDKIVIGIDACLSQATSVGKYVIGDFPIKPGFGVNKELPEVGKYSISGVVNVGGFMEYFVLQNTRLALVMRMAEDIAEAINIRFPVSNTYRGRVLPLKMKVKVKTLASLF